MARTNPTDVKETFDTDLSDSAVDDWIAHANDIVNDIASYDGSIASGRLERIEKLLAQGFAAIQDPRLNSTGRETASANYQRQEEYPNDYIWAAVSADPTGIVASKFKQTATLSVPDTKGIYD